ncbi:MAG TPA: DUF4105 domain-containing protein [Methylomirabilota bacterium]|nr:DUF4105 domain-containing protein [Methylomirabilota bacterium]
MRRAARRIGRVGLALLGVVAAAAAVLWGVLALYLGAPGGPRGRLALALVFVAASAALFLAVRPRRRAYLGFAALFALLLAWWLSIPPRNDRDWQPDVAQLPWAEIAGDTVTVHNVRNLVYRSETDYDLQYETRTYRLSELRSLDLVLSYWGSPYIAHTIMSFGFADGRYLAISIEGRKEKGEGYSALKGFFRQYELTFVVADERDVIGVRTDLRDEDVYLFRMRTPPPVVRGLFLRYLEEINRLRDRPEWYNALTHNCTTVVRGLAAPGATRSWRSWKLYVNGFLPELGHEIGALDQSLPVAELRRRSRIVERARAAGRAADFSRRIRQGLPGIPDA